MSDKPDVKAFILQDFPTYQNTQFTSISGKDPIMYFLDKKGEKKSKFLMEPLSIKATAKVQLASGRRR